MSIRKFQYSSIIGITNEKIELYFEIKENVIWENGIPDYDHKVLEKKKIELGGEEIKKLG